MSKQKLLQNEFIGGLLLFLCAFLALIMNNSPMSYLYNNFFDLKIGIFIAEYALEKPLLLWINDGLMAIFFLLVGLELKREILEGELRDPSKICLPIAGAVGGMAAPILIYYFFNINSKEYLEGWAIPMATDIAFALGVLALFGKRVPVQLKLFLLTLAIIDDIGAILVIGLFHTNHISGQALAYAQAAIICLILMNMFNVRSKSFYLLFGALLWLTTLKSGFHATIAGVILAFTIPLKVKGGIDVLQRIEIDLRPLVTFFILPVFAFANSGIPFNNIDLSDLYSSLFLGVSIGLVIGNSIGITFFTFMTQKLFNIKTDFSLANLIGTSFVCGIGFTMSLFIASLAFGYDAHLLNLSRLGIISGSFISMIIGIIILQFTLPKNSS